MQTDGKKARQLKQNASHSHILYTSKVNRAGPISKGGYQGKIIIKIKKDTGPLLPISNNFTNDKLWEQALFYKKAAKIIYIYKL